MRVAAAPEKGKANDALVRFLARSLDVRRDALRIVGGHTGRDKLVEVDDLTQAELETRFAQIAEERS